MLGLGIQLADRYAHLGLGLQHPHPGDLQRQVLLIGLLDQAIEDRVVEGAPPVPVIIGLGGYLLVLPGLQPILIDVGLGFHEVGPHLGAPGGQEQEGQ